MNRIGRFEFPTEAERRAEVERDRLQAYDRLGQTAAVDLLYTLPYSTIPDWRDVNEVIDWFEANGWRKEADQ